MPQFRAEVQAGTMTELACLKLEQALKIVGMACATGIGYAEAESKVRNQQTKVWAEEEEAGFFSTHNLIFYVMLHPVEKNEPNTTEGEIAAPEGQETPRYFSAWISYQGFTARNAT